MALSEGERYAATIKRKDGKFRRAVVRAKGSKILRWELFDGKGNEIAPKPSNETVSQPTEGEDEMPAKPKAVPKVEGEGGAGDAPEKGRSWGPWIAVAGFVVIGAAVGAALWTRRNGGLTPGNVFGKLRAVA